MSKAIQLKLDEGLVSAIDRRRGDVPRTVWIVRACEDRLRRDTETLRAKGAR